MKLLKRIAGTFLAAVVALGCTTAYASTSSTSDASSSSGTAASVSARPGGSQDGYVRWTGSAEPSANRKYYIDGTVKLSKKAKVVFPAGSTLELRSGADLQIFVGSSLQIRGDIVIREGAKLTVSGTLITAIGSSLENYGKFTSTKSSSVKISSTFTSRENAETVFGGEVFVYQSGVLRSEGSTTFAASSDVKVTGSVNTAEGGTLFAKGKLAVTLSGKIVLSGDLCLYTRLVNSGVVTLNYGSRYFKSTSAVLAVTKSGRINDNRAAPPVETTRPIPEPLPNGRSFKGIDVSSWQDTIDWNRVKGAGVDFAMLRSSFYIKKDRTFDYNIVEAQKAGVMVGVYHYCYAESVAEAREEAQYFMSVIEPYDLDFPVVLDLEDPSQEDLGKSKLTSIAKAFLDELKNAGYYAMLYSNKHWLETKLDMDRLSGYDVWLAEWHTAPSWSGNFGMWQYSSEGRVSGISGDVDLNICYRDYYKIISNGNYKR